MYLVEILLIYELIVPRIVVRYVVHKLNLTMHILLFEVLFLLSK